MVDEVVDHVRESCKHSNQRNCIFTRSTAILGIPVGQIKGLQPGNSLVETLYAINIFFRSIQAVKVRVITIKKDFQIKEGLL